MLLDLISFVSVNHDVPVYVQKISEIPGTSKRAVYSHVNPALAHYRRAVHFSMDSGRDNPAYQPGQNSFMYGPGDERAG